MTCPLENRIELLLQSFGVERLLEELDIEPETVILMLLEQGEITEEQLYEL